MVFGACTHSCEKHKATIAQNIEKVKEFYLHSFFGMSGRHPLRLLQIRNDVRCGGKGGAEQAASPARLEDAAATGFTVFFSAILQFFCIYAYLTAYYA